MAKKENNMLLYAGIVLAIIFFTTTDFLGALVTTCENTEPTNETYFQFNLTNGFSTGNPLDLTINNETLTFHTHTSNSDLGVFGLIDIEGYDCNGEIMPAMQSIIPNSSVKTVSGKTVLDVGAVFYWCNKDNNMMLLGTPSDYLSYMTAFEVCTTIEILPAVNETNETISVSAGRVSTTTTTTPTVEEPVIEDLTNRNRLIALGALILVGFLYYWFFEKGEKGIIRKRKKR